MSDTHYDLCIIGGGINGAGIARDAAGRGLSVLLVEGDDLGSGTSSASTKLIHGGLRYLEHMNFRLVRESLAEREALLRVAPHLVRGMEFVLPMGKGGKRPIWKIRLGLWLYDLFAGNSRLAHSRFIRNLGSESFGVPLRPEYKKGFVYSDAWGDDTRLVVLNAVDALENGADIRLRTICTGIQEDGKVWSVALHDRFTEKDYSVHASAVINATGPWVGRFLKGTGLGDGDPELPGVRLVQGSHIILPRQLNGEESYLLQQKDGRVVFVIPYENDFTLVGTTEVDFNDDPKDAEASEEEVAYLCEAYNMAFKAPVLPEDALFTFSGIRALVEQGQKRVSAISRDCQIYHHKGLPLPLISIFGGKLTTYRAQAERAVDMVSGLLNVVTDPWTDTQALPGGDFRGGGLDVFIESQCARYPWLPPSVLRRYAQAYGTRMDRIVGEGDSLACLGHYCGQDVYEAELRYLVDHEMAQTDEDILWRRSKLGLKVTDETLENIASVLSTL